MFRSTDAPAPDAPDAEVIGAGGLATPYFMLVQMNNAALLEAYATLGISPRPARVTETAYPSGFDLGKALSAIPFGQEDRAEHPGHLHESGADPIREIESMTDGTASGALAVGASFAARFASNSGGGGSLGAEVASSMARAAAALLEFDPSIQRIGTEILGRSAGQASVSTDGAGAAPFTGFRPDYRPETAGVGPKRSGVRRTSQASTHIGGVDIAAAMAASLAEIAKGRRRGAGTGRNRKGGG